MPKKQPDITRKLIIEAAFNEIYKVGFQAASMNNILPVTGLTKGALYHHFPDKKSLGLAVIEEEIATNLDNKIFQPLQNSNNPLLTLIEIIQNMRESTALQKVKLGCPLNNLVQEMSPLDDAFRQALNQILKKWHITIRHALEKGKETGIVRTDCDTEATSLFIICAWEGCIGISKNLQSVDSFASCLSELEKYILSLKRC